VGSFDEIAHEPLLARIPVFDGVVRQWLKAGVVELGRYTDTEQGVPQGGPLSPVLANIVLDGMERQFGAEDKNGQPITPPKRAGRNRGISLIRYADDVLGTAPRREVLESEVEPRMEQFLAERGLTVNAAKTRIVHREEGFNFLGFTIRRLHGKLLIRPQKEKVQGHLREIKELLDNHKQMTQEDLVRLLNPVIRGWANYYRHVVSSATFRYLTYRYWQMLWQWAKRRHPNKSKRWIREKYFKSVGLRNWVFGNDEVTLFNPTDIKITRYIKVQGRASPYNPEQREYWAKRAQHETDQISSWRVREVLRAQNYHCGACEVPFQAGDEIDLHHCRPRAQGGTEDKGNLVALHEHCHYALHKRRGDKVLKARAVCGETRTHGS
jgi:RNA-directed DNA polymerase